MRIVVVGGGAVGSLLGACLGVAGHDVTLLDRRPRADVDPGRLELVGPGAARRWVAVRRASAAEAVPYAPDVVVLAVKMFDLDAAVDLVARWPAAPAMTVQNGVGAEELVARRRPEASLVAGSLTAAVELDAGAVRWLRRGGIGLAPAHGAVGDLVRRLSDAFAAAGLPATVCADANTMKWSKLLGNLVGNATGALLDLDPGTVYAEPRLFRVERRQLLEAVAVMTALGLRPVTLPGAHAPLLVRALMLPEILGRPILSRVVRGARGGKMPSLRLALRTGSGPTEVAWLNGAVADTAARIGLATPVNRRLSDLVAEAASDPERRAWLRGRPDRLLAEFGSDETASDR